MGTRAYHNQRGKQMVEKHFGRPLTRWETARVNKVNQLLDQFAKYPDFEFLRRHRKFLHHKEGIEYFAMRFGELGGIVAYTHVMDDCGHIPVAMDYYERKVDDFGNLK